MSWLNGNGNYRLEKNRNGRSPEKREFLFFHGVLPMKAGTRNWEAGISRVPQYTKDHLCSINPEAGYDIGAPLSKYYPSEI